MYGCFKHVHWIHLEFIPLTSVQRQHLGVFGTRGCGGCDEGLVCVYNAQTKQIKKLGFSTQTTLPEVVNHRMTESILHCVLCKPNFTPHQKASMQPAGNVHPSISNGTFNQNDWQAVQVTHLVGETKW